MLASISSLRKGKEAYGVETGSAAVRWAGEREFGFKWRYIRREKIQKFWSAIETILMWSDFAD
jgi:hypothetical protein